MGYLDKYNPISHDELLSGIYKDIVHRGSEHKARIWYNSDGLINEKVTYSFD